MLSKTNVFLQRELYEGVIYPESDGMPMADNTAQFQWLTTIKGNLDAIFAEDPNVFVAGDLLWYPVKGHPEVRTAPDAMVVFGRPKGHRGSYMQFAEENIPPQVVFEILSPGNTPEEMARKRSFFERHGVEEYYLYDPTSERLEGWQRQGDRLVAISTMQGWISPRLGIRFVPASTGLQIFRPDGGKFLTFVELDDLHQQAQVQAIFAEERAERADERAVAADQRARQEAARAEQAEAYAQRLADKLRALGIDPATLTQSQN